MVQIKSGLSSRKVNYISSEFFDLHRYIEAYIKRILLIALRLNGVKYKESTIIVERTYLNTAKLIETVLFLLDQSGDNQNMVVSKLKKRHKDFFVLKELLLKFSSKYRNWLAHGAIIELKDTDLINHLCYVNKSFFKEFENLLKNEYGHSAFNKPGDWGAKKGVDEKIEDTAKRLGLGRILDQPLTLQVVKNRLSTTNYANP
jgi:hypothetical protein